MSQRTQRLDVQIRHELMELLQREMKDPRLGFVTITRVETARDLSSARVWASVLGSDEEREQTMRALSAAAPWLRHKLAERLEIRTVPQLLLRRDDSIEAGDRVLRLLRQLEDESRPTTLGLAEDANGMTE